MRFQSLFLTFVLFACVGVSTPAQSGRTKPSPTPTPTRTISGPSALTSATPSAKPVAVTTSTARVDDDIIKVESVLVPIPVSVTDERGRAVGTLKLTDFELKVGGKAAEIAELTSSDSAIRLAMLFDNSSSVSLIRDFEKAAAIRFFRRVIRPDRDMAALFSVADDTRLEQPFTRDIAVLTQAIEYFPEPKGATALLDGIIEVAEYLKATSGRRVLVIVSDGEDTYSNMKTSLEGVIRSLQVSDVQVYVVKTKEFENFKRTGMRGGNANLRSLTAERRMIDIASATGGAVYSPIDEQEMKDAFDRISSELSQQYILSYYPENEADKRGEFRPISITVKAKPNLTLRTRKGYYVPRK